MCLVQVRHLAGGCGCVRVTVSRICVRMFFRFPDFKDPAFMSAAKMEAMTAQSVFVVKHSESQGCPNNCCECAAAC